METQSIQETAVEAVFKEHKHTALQLKKSTAEERIAGFKKIPDHDDLMLKALYDDYKKSWTLWVYGFLKPAPCFGDAMI